MPLLPYLYTILCERSCWRSRTEVFAILLGTWYTDTLCTRLQYLAVLQHAYVIVAGVPGVRMGAGSEGP